LFPKHLLLKNNKDPDTYSRQYKSAWEEDEMGMHAREEKNIQNSDRAM
jgi:hypothetical protein